MKKLTAATLIVFGTCAISIVLITLVCTRLGELRGKAALRQVRPINPKFAKEGMVTKTIVITYRFPQTGQSFTNALNYFIKTHTNLELVSVSDYIMPANTSVASQTQLVYGDESYGYHRVKFRAIKPIETTHP